MSTPNLTKNLPKYWTALGDNLKSLRMDRDRTQEAVGDLLRRTASNMASWERGARKPRLPEVLMLADYFGVAVDDLFDRTPAIPARGTIIVPETTRKRATKRPKKPAKKRVRKKK